MTLIASWKNKSGIFVAGDSVISSSQGKTNGKFTSFGESTEIDEVVVNDKCLKVDVLHEKLIVAGAGSDAICRDFVQDLNRKLELSKHDIISLIDETLDEYQRTDSCAFLFAFKENDVAYLFSYNDNESNQTTLREIDGFVYAGSVDDALIEVVSIVYSLFSKINFSNEKTMVSLCAILQSFVLRHPQIENGIGGLFTGAYVDDDSIKWMRDSTFILYNEGFGKENSGINISVALRENGVFIYTPQEGIENKIYLNTHTLNPQKEIQKWVDKYYEGTNKKVNASDSGYLVFIHTTEAIVSILATDFKDYVKLISTEELRREYSFHPDWMNKLFTQRIPKEAKKGEGIPITFNWGWN